MINPNKVYTASKIGILNCIDEYRDKFSVSFGDIEYSGWISNIPNFKRFKVGDKVKTGGQFFITSECYRIVRMRKVNK